MSVIASELEQRLLELDAESAAKLEKVVRDLIDFSRSDRKEPAKDANGWPVGHFEKYAGCLEGDPLEAPDDPRPSPVDR